jgi:hypothetical protein
MLASCSASSSALKMETICSSEMLVDFQQTTCRYITEDSTLLHTVCSQDDLSVVFGKLAPLKIIIIVVLYMLQNSYGACLKVN